MPEILTKAVRLPAKVVPAVRLSPKILIIYGVPKVGKTKSLSDLPDCLILDTDKGAEGYASLRVPIDSPQDFIDTGKEIAAEFHARVAAGKTGDDRYPYRYIAIDTLDILEDMAEFNATIKYKRSKLSSPEFKSDGSSILELSHGLGYYYLRKELIGYVENMSKYCRHLILCVHVKEKLLDKRGEQVKINDISLTGKLGSIMCSKADAIGYMFRQDNKLMISFETSDGSVMGARQEYLAGKKMQFDWADIFIEDPALKSKS